MTNIGYATSLPRVEGSHCNRHLALAEPESLSKLELDIRISLANFISESLSKLDLDIGY